MRTAPPGCLSLLVLGVLLLLPFFLANVLLTALAKLGLGPTSSLLVALGIFLGSTVNIPVTRIEQTEVVEPIPPESSESTACLHAPSSDKPSRRLP